jgi:HAD superfamily hydrolase (TIGR01459 family)
LTEPRLISGLRDIAGEYDAIVCDVWGVVHDGVNAYPEACAALRAFRERFGKVVLLSNAPRPPAPIREQLRRFGVPDESYDAIVTSGGASRDDLAVRAAKGPLKLFHIGPEARDKVIYEGLNVTRTGPEAADIVLLSDLGDHDRETPDDYADVLKELKARDLTVICANPDVMVPIAGKLIYCAGAVAREYEKLGGKVIYYGKPYPPIYAMALKEAVSKKRVLAIGDALETDIAGAANVGLDALFVAGGLHAKEVGPLTQASLKAFFAGRKTTVVAGVAMLKW